MQLESVSGWKPATPKYNEFSAFAFKHVGLLILVDSVNTRHWALTDSLGDQLRMKRAAAIPCCSRASRDM